ncbi:MAG: putative flagellar basal-body rod protein FlgB [Pseudomonadota bacterium]|jgi:flagellar basal-body rod protein FlgB
MDLSSLTLFRLAGKRMQYLGARHQVVTENVANADTPGFRARDLKPFDFQAAMAATGSVSPLRTDPLHLTGTRADRPFRDQPRPGSFETAPAGNSVVLEEQMMKAAEVRQAYDLAAGVMQKHVALLRHAWTSR